MAYRLDEKDQALIIDGWQDGIAQDPYSGPNNLQNVNINSVPGEVSAGFRTTAQVSTPSYSAITVTAAGSDKVSVSNSLIPSLEDGQAVYFTASTISGLTTGTSVFWVTASDHSSGTATLSFASTYAGSTPVTLGASGTAVMYTFNLTLGPRNTTYKNYLLSSNGFSDALSSNYKWLLDSKGLVWSNKALTSGGTGLASTSSWTYTGNVGNAGASPNTAANGNGFVYMQTANSSGGQRTLDGWLFVFKDGRIDYMKIEENNAVISNNLLTWVYNWKPSDGTVNNTSNYLNSSSLGAFHEAVTTPDGRVCFCDGYLVGRFYQTDLITPVAFDPQNTSTYTYNTYPILSVDDTAQSMSYLGSQLLIGSQKNRIYPWNLVDNQYTNPLILLPENDVRTIVTVNLQAFIFCGNRGNIYITNGSQAELWGKVPDFSSGTVQPTMVWGGATYNQNTLYFGVFGTTNGSSSLVPELNYGGIWGINPVTKAMFVSNLMLGGTIAYPTAITADTPFFSGSTYLGYGLTAGYYGGTSPVSGVDGPNKNPYSNGTSVIDSELIPIGSFNQPKNFNQIEYKLAKPMVSGESIQVLYRTSLSDSFTSIFTDNTTGNFSNTFPTNFKNSQWIQLRVVLTSTSTSPSFVRLKELRLFGMI